MDRDVENHTSDVGHDKQESWPELMFNKNHSTQRNRARWSNGKRVLSSVFINELYVHV